VGSVLTTLTTHDGVPHARPEKSSNAGAGSREWKASCFCLYQRSLSKSLHLTVLEINCNRRQNSVVANSQSLARSKDKWATSGTSVCSAGHTVAMVAVQENLNGYGLGLQNLPNNTNSGASRR
jgi:hypothetical protein